MKRFVSVLFLLFTCWLQPALAQVELVEPFPNLPDLHLPVDLQHAGDGSGRLYVVEREGLILAFDNDPGVSRVDTVLDLRAQVRSSYIEEGLLGLAFHPNYAGNGYFFVYYTSLVEPVRSIVARFTRSASDPVKADPETRHVVLEAVQPGAGHYGGQLAFGPDGYLYVALGDGECCQDPGGRGQDRADLFGSLLRIDVDHPSGELNYGIPPDNPFAGNDEGFREEIYAYGLRNPWRFSFDAVTGEIWVGDVGEGRFEEINLIEAGGNYGWNTMEASHCFAPLEDCDQTGRMPPIWEYGHVHSDSIFSGRSITGGYVYRGVEVPALVGRYVFGDWVSGRIGALAYDERSSPGDSTGGPVVEELLATGLAVSSFGVDEAGELYLVSYFDGRIYGLRPAAPLSASDPLPGPRMRLDVFGPNPFRSETVFEFEVEQAAPVRLAVYDLLGREVAVLFDGVASPGLAQHVAFEASTLRAGVYFCRMEMAGRSTTRKVVFLP